MEVAAELEQRTGKPVVSANQATIWAAFPRLGITGLQPGFGSLLDQLTRVTV
jgi:maleate cis-trans isomerase